jgi:extradiol dioxygenase family protein
MSLAMIHLSIPIREIQSTLAFYGDLLGCTATRVQADRIDFEFFGHHLVAQLSEIEAAHRSVNIGHDDYPLRHFGVIVEPGVYEGLLDRLRQAKVPFAMEPKRIFVGTPREQSVFLVHDPSGNAVEVKGLTQPRQVFSTQ